MPRIRLMTYNVHRCVGPRGNASLEDVAAVCADAEPDLLALQELDAPETDETEGVHHARDLAARLGMKLLFCRTFRRNVGFYGHALLSRFPLELVRATTLPGPGRPGSEPRGAIWARASLGRTTLDVISTHLGVTRQERLAQSVELLGERWLGSPLLARPCVLCGDLNALPSASTYRRIASRLRDAQRGVSRHRPRATFPSTLPVLRLDHVFTSDDVRVERVEVPWTSRARRASDHLPLIVDLEIGGPKG